MQIINKLSKVILLEVSLKWIVKQLQGSTYIDYSYRKMKFITGAQPCSYSDVKLYQGWVMLKIVATLWLLEQKALQLLHWDIL